jgi:hypothetical protein
MPRPLRPLHPEARLLISQGFGVRPPSGQQSDTLVREVNAPFNLELKVGPLPDRDKG